MGLPIVFGSQIQTVPIRTCACVYSPRQGTCSHHQAWLRKRLLLQRYFSEAISHWWCCGNWYKKNCLLWKTISFLVCGSTVSKKTELFLSCALLILLPGLCSTLLSQCCYPCVILCCARWVFNKRLEVTIPQIGPIAVSCLHHLNLLIALLLPLPFSYFAQEQFDFKSFNSSEVLSCLIFESGEQKQDIHHDRKWQEQRPQSSAFW